MSWQKIGAKGSVRLLAAGLAAGAVTLSAPPAHADTVSVRCSVAKLVEAIEDANRSPGHDTLNLARKCTYRLERPDTASPANGLPVITSDITINGNNATITRAKSAPAFRILLVGEEGRLVLNKTTISRGRATDCPAVPDAPGLVCGGGINNQGTMTVNHSRVIDNTAASDVFAEGGGIDNDGTATINYTDVSDNTASYTGTEPSAAAGGGIANDGPITVRSSRVTDNTVNVTENTDSIAFGSGHAAFAATRIEHTIIADNQASAPGGIARAALTNGVPSPDRMIVTDSILRDNTASAPDGIAQGGAIANNAIMSMIHSHAVNNTAYAPGGTARGGAIRIGPQGTLTLSSSTVRGNTAKAPNGGTAQGGGIDNPEGGTVTTNESHIRRNTAKAPNGGTSQGGGIYHATGSTTLNDSTVIGNKAGDGGGIFKASGTVTLNDSVVKRNEPNNCAGAPPSIPGCTG